MRFKSIVYWVEHYMQEKYLSSFLLFVLLLIIMFFLLFDCWADEIKYEKKINIIIIAIRSLKQTFYSGGK